MATKRKAKSKEQANLDALRAKISVTDLLKEFNVHLDQFEVYTACPIDNCKGSFHAQSNRYRCLRCKAQGNDALSLAMDMFGLDLRGAAKLLEYLTKAPRDARPRPPVLAKHWTIECIRVTGNKLRVLEGSLEELRLTLTALKPDENLEILERLLADVSEFSTVHENRLEYAVYKVGKSVPANSQAA